ncbi:hypothetical protein [Clostridium weizhouense]|uniref:Lipoprotein n=1 Tax=Clostridium weizhouense TaxID=2859781 RepID=A0ABS7AV49_9CLOT|nr:hypothetical protein [Clostridium weizhouense]MBW6411690.1 hypothetical protein [Clostridium weizhouense]
MKLKKLLIITVLISTTAILYGCSSSKINETSSDESNSTQSEMISDSTNSSAPKNSKTVSNDNVTQKPNKSTNDLIFKSKLGFSMQFPDNWKGKYKIKEDDEGLAVYFKSKDPKTPENRGLLFVIKKKYDSEEAEMFDSVCEKKFITLGNTTYLVGGPTDVPLDSTTTDINDFVSMIQESQKVIHTMKSIN